MRKFKKISKEEKSVIVNSIKEYKDYKKKFTMVIDLYFEGSTFSGFVDYGEYLVLAFKSKGFPKGIYIINADRYYDYVDSRNHILYDVKSQLPKILKKHTLLFYKFENFVNEFVPKSIPSLNNDSFKI